MYHKGFLLDPGKRHTFRKGKRTRPKHTAGADRRVTPRSITPTQEGAGSTVIARKRVVTETEINNPFREAERPAKPVSITEKRGGGARPDSTATDTTRPTMGDAQANTCTTGRAPRPSSSWL